MFRSLVSRWCTSLLPIATMNVNAPLLPRLHSGYSARGPRPAGDARRPLIAPLWLHGRVYGATGVAHAWPRQLCRCDASALVHPPGSAIERRLLPFCKVVNTPQLKLRPISSRAQTCHDATCWSGSRTLPDRANTSWSMMRRGEAISGRPDEHHVLGNAKPTGPLLDDPRAEYFRHGHETVAGAEGRVGRSSRSRRRRCARSAERRSRFPQRRRGRR